MSELLLPISNYLKKYRYKYLALYHCLRDAIIEGTLEDGFRLPASRQFANEYGISRGIVNQVYEMLSADGYITTKLGSGTYVTYSHIPPTIEEEEYTSAYSLSNWGKRLPSITKQSLPKKYTIHFSSQLNDLANIFPFEAWRKAIKQGFEEMDYFINMTEPDKQGLFELREAISKYLNTTRGMRTSPEEIVITNGSVHAMSILAHLLVNEGEHVLVENPSYVRLRNIIKTVGATPTPIPVNAQGDLNLVDCKSKIIYVTPSSQYPTGRLMTMAERIELLEWAANHQAIIIEDDIDSEFRRKGRPIEPLKVLDYDNRVIYLGTFAFTLLLHLRIGYAVLPKGLVDDFLRAKHIFEPYQTSIMEQKTIATFMKNGEFSKHIRKSKRIYTHKYTRVKSLFDGKLPGCFAWYPTDSGLHLFGWWINKTIPYEEFLRGCSDAGVNWEAPYDYFFEQPDPCALFHFMHLNEREIEQAVTMMKKTYDNLLAIFQKPH